MEIQINEKDYKIRYNEQALEIIEKLTTVPVLARMADENRIIPSLADLKIMFACGIVTIDGAKMSMEHALKLAGDYIVANGFKDTMQLVYARIQEDMAFLFL